MQRCWDSLLEKKKEVPLNTAFDSALLAATWMWTSFSLRVKLTKGYWLQVLSASPVWDSADSKAHSHCCTAAGAGGQSRPTYCPQRGRAVLGALGHSPFLYGNFLFPLLPDKGGGRKTISSDTEPEQVLCHQKVQLSSKFACSSSAGEALQIHVLLLSRFASASGSTRKLLKQPLGSVMHKRALFQASSYHSSYHLPFQRIK